MRKINLLAAAVLIIVSTSVFAAEKDLNLEKEVVGKNSKEYNQELKVNSKVQDKSVLDEKDLKVKLKEDKLDSEKDLKITDVKIDTLNGDEGLNYNIFINSEGPKVIVDQAKERDGSNYMIFGVGGYKRVDSFKYIIDYTKEDREKELAYFLHLGREIKGEYRFNNDMGVDNYFGKVWYKNFNMSLSHILSDEKISGQRTSTSSAVTWKKGKGTELGLGYDFIKGLNQSLKVSGTAYIMENDSSTKGSLREYDNRYFDIKLGYEKYFSSGNIKALNIGSLDNFLDLGIAYAVDNTKTPYTMTGSGITVNEDYKTVKIDIKDKIRVKNDRKLDFTLGTGIESIQGTKGEKSADWTNFSIEAGMTKGLSEKVDIGLKVEKNNRRKTTKELVNGFKVDRDILMPREVLNEDKIFGEFSAGYKDKNIFLGQKLRMVNVEDMIIYRETDTKDKVYSVDIYKDGLPITVSNAPKSVEYLELETNASVTINKIILEGGYIFSTVDNVPFASVHKVTGSITYRDDKHEAKVECLGNSDFYTTQEKNDKLKGFAVVNASYTNRFSSALDITGKITNVINTKYDFKTGYQGEPLKAGLEFKIKY